MKNAMYVAALTVVVLGGLFWIVTRKPQPGPIAAASIPLSVVEKQQPDTQILIPPAVRVVTRVVPLVQPRVEDTIASNGDIRHIALSGETVTSLAADVLGEDTQIGRNSIINANASLQADPDKLIEGKTYRIPKATEAPIAVPVPVVVDSPAPRRAPSPAPIDKTASPEPAPELRYTARPGDTVIKMAAAFLGSENKTRQSEIINANASLRLDPDHVVAGQAYRIPAPDGLSAIAASTPIATARRSATEPDADEVILLGSPRALRYTARAGDTVTTLATELLGSDTQAARDAIISNNPSLKRNPDRVVAGESYWIPAPEAAAPTVD